jgi:hypothetical protein
MICQKMMIINVQGGDAIVEVTPNKRVSFPTSVAITLPPRNVSYVVTVEPHIPRNKKELTNDGGSLSLSSLHAS